MTTWVLFCPPSRGQELSGPNRAMQPQCAMRFESHIPESLAMRKRFLLAVFFKIERCEMPAIRTPAAVWPAMRAPAMPNR